MEWSRHHEWKRPLKSRWHIRHTVPAGTDLVFSVGRKPYNRSQVWWPGEPGDSWRIQDSAPGFRGYSLGSSWESTPILSPFPHSQGPKAAFQLVSFNPPGHPILAHFNPPLPRQTRKLIFTSSVAYMWE